MLATHVLRTVTAYSLVRPCTRAYSTINRGSKPATTTKHASKKNPNNKQKLKLNTEQKVKYIPKADSEVKVKGDTTTEIDKDKKQDFVKGAPFSKRSTSTTKWIKRQLKDPYVKQAKAEGMVSRAAYKLQEMNKQVKFIRPGYSVLDLGAAPGGWTQVATSIVNEKAAKGSVLSVDINDMQDIAGSKFLKLDFSKDESIKTIMKALNGKKVDVVLSDMAPSYSGQSDTDHARLMELSTRAFDISKFILNNGGHFIVKISRGGTEKEFIEELKKWFRTVKMLKPGASRKESSEIYAAAKAFNLEATKKDAKMKALRKEWNLLSKLP